MSQIISNMEKILNDTEAVDDTMKTLESKYNVSFPAIERPLYAGETGRWREGVVCDDGRKPNAAEIYTPSVSPSCLHGRTDTIAKLIAVESLFIIVLTQTWRRHIAFRPTLEAATYHAACKRHDLVLPTVTCRRASSHLQVRLARQHSTKPSTFYFVILLVITSPLRSPLRSPARLLKVLWLIKADSSGNVNSNTAYNRQTTNTSRFAHPLPLSPICRTTTAPSPRVQHHPNSLPFPR